MSAPFVPPTASEIADRLVSDPEFRALVAEYVASDIAFSTTAPASYEEILAASIRKTDARSALADTIHGYDEANCAAIAARDAIYAVKEVAA